MSRAIDRYRDAIRSQVGSDIEVSFFWKGRVALYCILRALGVRDGHEVIVPGFTCVVVPNAVLYTGAKPVYADIDPETYTVTRDTIEPLLSEKTKVIVVQNTYGLSSDLQPILDLGAQRGISIVDDCAHGFGGTYKGRANGTITSAACFSTQWNKPFSTAIGGFTTTPDRDLGKAISRYEALSSRPTAVEVVLLRLMVMARRYLVTGYTYWLLVNLYRWLSDKDMIIGSSQGYELKTLEKPEGYLKGLSDYQAKIGVDELRRLPASNGHRRELAEEYDNLLGGMGISVPVRPEYAEHLFLKYPVRVKERDQILNRARENRVRIGDWFLSPLHPVKGDLSTWGYKPGSCPQGELLSSQTLNLPTDPDIGRNELIRIKKFVAEHRQYFL